MAKSVEQKLALARAYSKKAALPSNQPKFQLNISPQQRVELNNEREELEKRLDSLFEIQRTHDST